MAEEADIKEVQDSLPPEAETWGWGTARITEVLDSGKTVNRTILQFWNWRAGQTASYMDVSESGSSRQLGSVHDNAVKMRDYWAGIVKEEETTEPETTTRGRVAFHTATRV